jgi:hypothetical protein
MSLRSGIFDKPGIAWRRDSLGVQDQMRTDFPESSVKITAVPIDETIHLIGRHW